MDIQVNFTKEEQIIINKAIKIVISGCNSETTESDAFRKYFPIEETRQLPKELSLPFSQIGLNIVSRILAVGATHTDNSDDEFEMTKLSQNINVLTSIPQTT